MSDLPNSNDAKRSARRRLLRGAYAVPAVLTVQTGSALATSSALMCFNKLPTGIDIGPTDNFWRVQRYTAVVSSSSVKVVKASEVKSLCDTKSAGTINTSTFLGTKVWVRISDGAGVTPTGTPTSDGASNWVAIRIDNVGTPTTPSFRLIGVAPGTGLPGTAKVMAQSCWNSFIIG